ncbi:MAG TPA: hypothetical protein VF584_24310 [Longimicrobium sp.]|jgi:hypothetical protein
MSFVIGPRTHLGETDLLRYLDRQLDREALRHARHHLAQCTACAAQLAELERRSATVSALIGELPVQLPDSGKRAVALAAMDRARLRSSATGPLSGRVLLRAAALFMLGLLGALSTQPGRAWVSDRVEAVAGDNPGPVLAGVLRMLDGDEPPPPTAAAPPPVEGVRTQRPAATPRERVQVQSRRTVPPGTTAPVKFTPSGPEVTIRFETLQRGGTATLWLRDVEDATAQVTSGHRGERIVPVEGGVRVQNRASSRAHYMLTVPVYFRVLRVQVGDGPETLIPVSKSKTDWIWTIPLQASAEPSSADKDHN